MVTVCPASEQFPATAKVALSEAWLIEDPPAGVVIKMVGKTVSLVTETAAEVVVLVAASERMAVNDLAPSPSPVVSMVPVKLVPSQENPV